MKKAKKKVAKKAVKKQGRQVGTVLRSFVFTGDPKGDNPEYCSACGYLFTLNGRTIKVSSEAAERLCKNNHFTEK